MRGRPGRPLAAQVGALRRQWPAGRTMLARGAVRWIGPLQPTAVSREYTVSVVYRPHRSPEVRVLDPPLDPGDRLRLPHVYPGNRLCLYTQSALEWDETMLLADTIIPWAAEWLLHYEIWHVTGHWGGGGDVGTPLDEERRPA
jgi:hypothetical protein